jgi:hypothetical protein
MNLVVSWFSIAERQAIHRGTCTSVTDDILKKANRKKISSAEHWSTITRTRPAGSRDTREGGNQ